MLARSSPGATVRVWTAESRLINGELRPNGSPRLTRVPYDRIVSLEVEPGTVVHSPDRAETEEEAGELQERLLKLPDQAMADRLTYYFGTVIARNNVRLADVNTRPEANYNCHDFASTLVHAMPPQGYQAATDYVEKMRSAYKFGRPPLWPQRWRPWQHGIVMQQEPGDLPDDLLVHSFVSLGGNECLNVLGIGGALGITTLKAIDQEYWHPGYPGRLMAHTGEIG